MKLWLKSSTILRTLAEDERRFVRKSVSTTIQYLAKRNPDNVAKVLKGWSGGQFDNIKYDLEVRLE